MTKAELVAAIADQAGLNKTQAKERSGGVHHLGRRTSLKAGKEVRLVGFGSFVPVKRPAGTARNPRTGETVARRKASQHLPLPGGRGAEERAQRADRTVGRRRSPGGRLSVVSGACRRLITPPSRGVAVRKTAKPASTDLPGLSGAWRGGGSSSGSGLARPTMRTSRARAGGGRVVVCVAWPRRVPI